MINDTKGIVVHGHRDSIFKENTIQQCTCTVSIIMAISIKALARALNRPGFPGECFICELRLPDHRFRWKHNKLFLLLPEEYGPAFPAIVDCYTSPPT